MAIDPLTASTTFATIVSLISDFRDKHKEVAANDHEKFLEWLSENRHDEIKIILEQNQETIISIKAILNQDFTIISEKLQNIDNKLASLLSEDVLFSKLVEAINPERMISKQAVAVLIQFENSEASKLLEHLYTGGLDFIFIGGKGGTLDINEPRFIKDDFAKLIELGLLRQNYNSSGKPMYEYTRAASEFVKSIKN
jgi:hypothetical protein